MLNIPFSIANTAQSSSNICTDYVAEYMYELEHVRAQLEHGQMTDRCQTENKSREYFLTNLKKFKVAIKLDIGSRYIKQV